jgi:outer membrane protein OmpA-like peptidoglycan-associated protein
LHGWEKYLFFFLSILKRALRMGLFYSKLKMLMVWMVLMAGSFLLEGQNAPPPPLYDIEKEDRAVEIKNAVAVNTPSIEFAPTFYRNGMVFVSSRKKSGRIDKGTGETFYELYYTEFAPDGVPGKPQPFSVELNSQWHEGPVAFTKDWGKIYLTRSNSENGVTRANEEGKVVLKIYEASRGYWDWENTKELPFNDDQYSCMHPTLSKDGSRMYFISDMPGGFGGLDIWFVDLNDGKWSNPINLEGINTNKNEMFPFIHESGILFFSSNGYQGVGGLDLYMVDLNESNWKVVNLGAPFNTSADDFALALDEEGRKGYFSSNRKGGMGKDDIFYFELATEFINVRLIQKETEQTPDEPTDLITDRPNPSSKQPTDPLSGIRPDEKRPFTSENQRVTPKEEAPKEEGVIVQVIDTEADRGAADVSIRIVENDEVGKPLSDTSVYETRLVPSLDNPNEYVMKRFKKQEGQLRNPDAVTNGEGIGVVYLEENQSYTLVMSKPGYRDEEAQINYEGRPVDTIKVALERINCLTINGAVLSRGFNSGIPNAIIRVVNEQTGEEQFVSSDMAGRFVACLELGSSFLLVGQKDGYQDGNSRISTTQLRNIRSMEANIILQPMSSEIVSKPLKEGSVIILNDIYYDFGKSAIRKGAARDLELIAEMMKNYPSMMIELGAYTDSRGEADFNMQLSLRRAESAKNFLVQRGIQTTRIKTFGYGESRLRNHCTDGVECSEDEHAYNRRTEIRVIKINEPIRFERKND